MATSSDFDTKPENECAIPITNQGRTPDKEASMESNTAMTAIGPKATTQDIKLWQSVHDFLDDPPPLAVLLRNPWKWLNSRSRNQTQNNNRK